MHITVLILHISDLYTLCYSWHIISFSIVGLLISISNDFVLFFFKFSTRQIDLTLCYNITGCSSLPGDLDSETVSFAVYCTFTSIWRTLVSIWQVVSSWGEFSQPCLSGKVLTSPLLWMAVLSGILFLVLQIFLSALWLYGRTPSGLQGFSWEVRWQSYVLHVYSFFLLFPLCLSCLESS